MKAEDLTVGQLVDELLKLPQHVPLEFVRVDAEGIFEVPMCNQEINVQCLDHCYVRITIEDKKE